MQVNDWVVFEILHELRPKEIASLHLDKPGLFNAKDYFKSESSKTLKRFDFKFLPFSKSVLDQFDAYQVL